MLLRLFKYCHGYVKIRLEGYSPERLLNLCNVNQIVVWGVENQELIYELYISVRDYKRLRPFARKTRTKIILLEKHGLPFFLHKFRKRKTFFAGILLCILLIYGMSLFVWNIHIQGNVTQTTEELLGYLETLGVKHGTIKSKIQCESIETNLRGNYPNILWVSAEMRGTRIVIQIKENTDEDIVSKVEMKDTDPASIVSDTAGIIESMIVRQGTPAVVIGEEVCAGQILVEGYYAIKNDAGDILRYEGVNADADISLVANEIYTDQFSAEYEIKKFTKRKRLGLRIKLFDRNYEFSPQIPFKSYDLVSKQQEIHLTENYYLPFSIELLWYLEYVPEKRLYGREEVIELAQSRYLNKYKNILQKGVQIIEKDVRIDINGKLCIVGGSVTLRIPITKKMPAAIPEISKEIQVEGEH